MTERYEWVSVSGGKFHRPVQPDMPADASPWRPTAMTCGRTVTPSNYFPTRADALHYCGNRAQFLCSRCGEQ